MISCVGVTMPVLVGLKNKLRVAVPVLLVILGLGLVTEGFRLYNEVNTVSVADRLDAKMQLSIWPWLPPNLLLKNGFVEGIGSISLDIDASSPSRPEAALSIRSDQALPPLRLAIPHKAQVTSIDPEPSEWHWPSVVREFWIAEYPDAPLPKPPEGYYSAEDDTTFVYINWTDGDAFKDRDPDEWGKHEISFLWQYDISSYTESWLSVPMYVEEHLIGGHYGVVVHYTGGIQEMDFSATSPQPDAFSAGWAAWEVDEFFGEPAEGVPIADGELFKNVFFESFGFGGLTENARSKTVVMSFFSPARQADKEKNIFLSGVLIALGSSVLIEVIVSELRRIWT